MRATVLLLSLCFLPQSLSAQQQSAAPYRNRALPIDTRVSDLLDRMTLEEKFWQLYMSPGDLDDSAHDYHPKTSEVTSGRL